MKGSWSSHLVDLVWACLGVPAKPLSMYSIRELILWPQVLPVSSFLLRLEHFCSKSPVLVVRVFAFLLLFFFNPKRRKRKTVTCHGPSCGSDKQTKFASLPFSADYTVAWSLLEWVWTAPQSEATAPCRESASSLPPAASGERKASGVYLRGEREPETDERLRVMTMIPQQHFVFFKIKTGKEKKITHGHELKEDNLCAKKIGFLCKAPESTRRWTGFLDW